MVEITDNRMETYDGNYLKLIQQFVDIFDIKFAMTTKILRFIVAKFNIEECDFYLVVISAVFELLTDHNMKTNDKILYYALSLIGTCAWPSNSAKESIMQIFDDQFKKMVNNARHSSTNEACRQI
eukprot:36824_1